MGHMESLVVEEVVAVAVVVVVVVVVEEVEVVEAVEEEVAVVGEAYMVEHMAPVLEGEALEVHNSLEGNQSHSCQACTEGDTLVVVVVVVEVEVEVHSMSEDILVHSWVECKLEHMGLAS